MIVVDTQVWLWWVNSVPQSLTPQIAHLSSNLPDIHKDSADRIIITTAMLAGAKLATADEAVRRYTNVEFAW